MLIVSGNQLVLLKNGEQYFPALVKAIDEAREEVFLESYIFQDDEAGSLVAGALCRAAARGVAVQLLIDGFGSRAFPVRLRKAMTDQGVRLQVFRPKVRLWQVSRARLRRMHRKLAVIDSKIGFVGGINVIDDRNTPGQTPPRFDYAVRIVGPIARDMRGAAARLWILVSLAHLGRHGVKLSSLPELHSGPWARTPAAGGRVRFVVRDSVGHRRDIENAMLEGIISAHEEILIACAYFLPGRRFRKALMEASARGVRVVLMLQGRVEYALLHYASRALYGSLLESGVEIYEYHRSFLHAKVAVIDRRLASIGSSNIDPFSLLLAREANLFVEDHGFAAELRDSLEEAMRTGATQLPRREWSRLPWPQRFLIWAGYALARGLTSFAGFEPYH